MVPSLLASVQQNPDRFQQATANTLQRCLAWQYVPDTPQAGFSSAPAYSFHKIPGKVRQTTYTPLASLALEQISTLFLHYLLLPRRVKSLQIHSLIARPFHDPCIPSTSPGWSMISFGPDTSFTSSYSTSRTSRLKYTASSRIPLFSWKSSSQICWPQPSTPFHVMLASVSLFLTTWHLQTHSGQTLPSASRQAFHLQSLLSFTAQLWIVSLLFSKISPLPRSKMPHSFLLYHSWHRLTFHHMTLR